ncbi:hypothetical protein PMAYCL1PPCAC_01351, partial [Pristionchus mayeri]
IFCRKSCRSSTPSSRSRMRRRSSLSMTTPSMESPRRTSRDLWSARSLSRKPPTSRTRTTRRSREAPSRDACSTSARTAACSSCSPSSAASSVSPASRSFSTEAPPPRPSNPTVVIGFYRQTTVKFSPNDGFTSL